MRTRAFPLILGCALASVLVLDTAAVWARAGSGGLAVLAFLTVEPLAGGAAAGL
jgi:hypothetical protein